MNTKGPRFPLSRIIKTSKIDIYTIKNLKKPWFWFYNPRNNQDRFTQFKTAKISKIIPRKFKNSNCFSKKFQELEEVTKNVQETLKLIHRLQDLCKKLTTSRLYARISRTSFRQLLEKFPTMATNFHNNKNKKLGTTDTIFLPDFNDSRTTQDTK